MKKNAAKKIVQWILLILSVGFVLRYFSTNREEVRQVLGIRPLNVVLLIFLYTGYLPLQAYRYQIVLEKCSGRLIAFGPWFKIFVLGRFLNLFIPQAGNIYRSVLLKRDHGVTYTRYISSFFSFVWMDTCFNLLLALLIVGLTSPNLHLGSLQVIYLILMLLVLLVGLPILFEAIVHRFTIRARLVFWIQSKLAEVLQVSVQNLRDVHYMTKVFLVGLAVFFQACLLFYVCFLSIGVHVNVAELICFYVFLKLSMYINFTPGNVGVQEIGFGIISQQMQMSMGEGMLFSAILRVVDYITLLTLALPMGGLNLLRHREQYRARDSEKP